MERVLYRATYVACLPLWVAATLGAVPWAAAYYVSNRYVRKAHGDYGNR